MSELEAFVRARIEEDERAAESRDTSKPIHETGCYYYNNQYDPAYCDCDGPLHALRDARAKLALLADIAAERHLVVGDPWYTCFAATEEREGETTAREDENTACDCGRDERVERRLRLLAAVWRDDPDYCEEWRT